MSLFADYSAEYIKRYGSDIWVRLLNSLKLILLTTDVVSFTKLILKNIERLKKIQTIQRIDHLQKENTEHFKNLIEEAHSWTDELNKSMENAEKELDQTIKDLLDEIQKQLDSAEKDQEALQKAREKFSNQMKLKLMFGGLKTIAKGISFAGPKGAIAGTVIESLSDVSEKMLTEEVDTSMGEKMFKARKDLAEHFTKWKSDANTEKMTDAKAKLRVYSSLIESDEKVFGESTAAKKEKILKLKAQAEGWTDMSDTDKIDEICGELDKIKKEVGSDFEAKASQIK